MQIYSLLITYEHLTGVSLTPQYGPASNFCCTVCTFMFKDVILDITESTVLGVVVQVALVHVKLSLDTVQFSA